jgi:NADH-quinone oxidoreductase subunit L
VTGASFAPAPAAAPHLEIHLEAQGGAGGAAHTAPSAAAEWAATAAALAAGLAGLGLGHQLYRRRPEGATALAARLPRLHSLLEHKYWVDEIYDGLVVRPTRRLSEGFLWRVVDVRFIDGLVNLLAGFTKAFSYVFRFVQSGYVQTYALVLVLGVLVLLLRSI